MKYRGYKTITTIIKSFDAIGTIVTTSSSITLSVTGVGFRATPISTSTAIALSTGNKVIQKTNMQK